MFPEGREDMRRIFLRAWEKHSTEEPLEEMERRIVDVILLHPEYHQLLADGDHALSRDYSPEQGVSNPFLHMGLHIAIREQLATGRPSGIESHYQALLLKLRDPHQAEHHMLECLGEVLWRAQRDAAAPDEAAYLECLREISDKH
ncbi:MAG: DUF1841 family protein [Gammaproteobacteria bacterium]|nr:DUF1841 family protein [Gammaproteobacteria bacterium]